MPEAHEPIPAHHDAELSEDEKHLAKLGYKQELNRSWSGFSNFAISFSIISILAGCFTNFGAGFEQRRSDLDLVVLADPRRLHPDHRLHDVRAGVGVPDLGRHLLVGVEARRPAAGFFTGWLNLIGLVAVTRRCRVRVRDLHRPDDQHLVRALRRRATR